jgi:tRNA (guanine10-N2)-dimethyltransferase
MAGMVFLTGEAPDLALAEVKGALKAIGSTTQVRKHDHQIVVLTNDPPRGLASRLGFSHFSGMIDEITSFGIKEVLEGVHSSMQRIDEDKSISWQVKVPKDLTDFSSSDLFQMIDDLARANGRLIKHREPDQKIFVIVRKEAYIGRILEISDRLSAESRRGSKMPFNRPIVMDPRLSRVLVNLSGLPIGSKVLDPFIGPAGLAIEAATLGLKVFGVEKDPEIYRGARINIEHLGLSNNILIRNGDSRKIAGYPWSRELDDIDGVITDPPFGRSATTGGSEPGKLINDVMGQIFDMLPKLAPLVIDSHSPAIIENIRGFHAEEMFNFRIHKSMTRHIALLRKN